MSPALSANPSVFLEQAPILSHQAFPAEQYVLRLQAPRCAAHAAPGSFVHVQCDPLLPMRRPFSIMRTSPEDGWVELLYKVVGYGTRLLAERRAGEQVSLLGPVGVAFQRRRQRPQALLIGGGVGIPPMVFLAQRLHSEGEPWRPLVLMGSEVPFPFELATAAQPIGGIPESVNATLGLLEQWGVPCRLSSQQPMAGCHRGYVTELAEQWLEAQAANLGDVEIFACGPHPMLEAVAGLARRFSVPCQVALEEFMACGIGGCAGCTVEVRTAAGTAMKRVCVDGPVFDAETVFFS